MKRENEREKQRENMTSKSKNIKLAKFISCILELF